VVVPQSTANFGEFQRLLAHIDYFLPNGEEARQITGRSDPLEQLRAFGDAGANTVIITRDKAGAVAGRSGEYWRCGVFPVAVVDPSGSGDAFSAGIITGVLRGWDMPQILRYASALGASATQAVGTTDGVFTAAEAEEFVASRPLPIACGAL
jgi:sugar/nucleoside kinase (ribokinase family)